MTSDPNFEVTILFNVK